MTVRALCKTELALLSRLVFVDYALMAQSYKLLSKSGFIHLRAGFALACAWSAEESGCLHALVQASMEAVFLSYLRPEHWATQLKCFS